MTLMPRVCPVLSLLVFACVGTPEPGPVPAPDPDDEPGPDPGPGTDPDPDPGTPQGAGRVIGYYPAWAVYARDYQVAEIPADLLTHVNYGFANVSAELEIALGDRDADLASFEQLQLLEEAHPHLRTLISVGGWTWSGRFSDVALTEESRRRFAHSCAVFAALYRFDGVDIDWEYPGGGGLPSNTSRPEDGANYVLLLRELRAALDAQGALDGKTYLLTIAAPAPRSLIDALDVEEMVPLLDWVNLMSYDFHGGWESTTNFNAPLHTDPADPAGDQGLDVAAAVAAWLARGIPRAKLVVGMPFYGRGWAGVPATNDGLYQPSTSLPPGTYEAGVFDYRDLVANYLPSMTRYFNAASQAPWLYDAARGVMISYEDPESIAAKAAFVASEGLGGGMVWDLSSDTGDSTLLETLHATLR
jgi:chitinase